MDDDVFSENETSVEPSGVLDEDGPDGERPIIIYAEDDVILNNNQYNSSNIQSDQCSCEFCYPAILTAAYWFVMWAVLIYLANDTTR